MTPEWDLGLCVCGQPAIVTFPDGVACWGCMERRNVEAFRRIRGGDGAISTTWGGMLMATYEHEQDYANEERLEDERRAEREQRRAEERYLDTLPPKVAEEYRAGYCWCAYCNTYHRNEGGRLSK